ncbi:period circadian protein-like protein [Leptotrombidium deliense]|uniref:Period circadian protein n=1 Tax=Leptotrombidium deliense TaxID=299467 RepID=A0A443SLQ4_9ACAR|nr:period circadian protein-like protein [Leptotrombidium deliense]
MKIVHEELKEPSYGWTPEYLSKGPLEHKKSKTSFSEHGNQFKRNRFNTRELESSFTSFKVVNPEAIDAQEARSFSLVISLHDATVLHASNSIIDALGFPKDMLNGQCLLNYLYPRDKPTFSNYLSQALQSRFAMSANQPKRDKFTFYVRFREYMSLKKGFGIVNRKATYKPFQLTCTTRDVLMGKVQHSQRKYSLEKNDHLNAYEDENEECDGDDQYEDEELCNMFQTVCLVVTAALVKSAYQVPNEVSPAMTPFTTRHTSSCHFSYIDSSAVSYLGYLPQDLIGYSVFDFYKCEDFDLLREVYETLTCENSRLFRSNPYSFKAFNGDFVTLETDWSCFTNPWSKKIEFVVGQHRVLSGPSNPDVFKEPECLKDKNQVLNDTFENVNKFQDEIKLLLNAPIKKCKSSTTEQDIRRKRKLAMFVSNIIDGIGNNETDASLPVHCTSSLDSPDTPAVGESRAEYCELQESYQETRLLDNIERFFRSNPKSHCPPSERNSSSTDNSSPDGDSNESSEGTSNTPSSDSVQKQEKKKAHFSIDLENSHKHGKKNSLIKTTSAVTSTSTSLPLTEDVLHLHEKNVMKEFLKNPTAIRSTATRIVSPNKENPNNKLKRTWTPDTIFKHSKKHQKIQRNEKVKALKGSQTDEKSENINVPFSIASLIIPLPLTPAADGNRLCPSCHFIGSSPQLFMPIIPIVIGADLASGTDVGNHLDPKAHSESMVTRKRSIEVQTDTELEKNDKLNDQSMLSASNTNSSSGSGNEMVVSSSSDSDGLKSKQKHSTSKEEKCANKSPSRDYCTREAVE